MLVTTQFTSGVRRFSRQWIGHRATRTAVAAARRRIVVPLLIVGLATSLLGAARADEIAIAPPDTPHNGFAAGLVFGWQFSPNQDIRVTALGWYDHEHDGFHNGSHAVGMFRTSDESLLVDALIESDSALEGDYRYESVASTLLTAGEDYIVAGFDPAGAGDRYPVGADLENMNLHPQLSFQHEVSEEAASLVFPDQLFDLTSPWHLPANFQFTVVPEPHSGALALAAALGLLLAQRWRVAELNTA